MTIKLEKVAETVSSELIESGTNKKMKIKTLLGLFGYDKRRESNVLKITQAF